MEAEFGLEAVEGELEGGFADAVEVVRVDVGGD